MHAVGWRGHDSFRFECASIMVRDDYGDSKDYVVLIVSVSSVFCLVDDNKYWNLGDIPFSLNAKVCASLQQQPRRDVVKCVLLFSI